MVLLNEKVIIFFDYEVFPTNKLGCLKFIEEIVIDIGALFDKFKLCSIAVGHASIEFPL